MKNYFDFTLDPKKFLPFWLMFLVGAIAPYVYLLINTKQHQPHTPLTILDIVAIVLMIVVGIVIYYFFLKLYIESLKYKEQNIKFNGSFGTYIGKMILGIFLSIITLGIYSPWFQKNLTDFYAENTSFNSTSFKFSGKGLKLFWIMTLSFILPLITINLIFTIYYDKMLGETPPIGLIQLISYMLIIPFYYLMYKWYFDIDYKEYHISWETTFWNSCGKILLEMFLSVITLGIYAPLAYVKLYKYFVERTVAVSPKAKLKFGFDIEALDDFLFLWGQGLLCIITLTIYTPWATSKIGKRFLMKTYLENAESLEASQPIEIPAES